MVVWAPQNNLTSNDEGGVPAENIEWLNQTDYIF